MADQYSGNGIYITFLCGPNKQQLVEITLLVRSEAIQLKMGIAEYADLFFRANSEANRRLALEKKRLRNGPEIQR